MMALETLLEPAPRSDESKHHINELINITKGSTKLSEKDKSSLTQSLEGLYKESIGKTGRKLAQRLKGNKYMDRNPKNFFSYCYELRSKLVHGSVPRPERNDVDIAAAHLESFVADLLSGPLLERIKL
jgi:hypothetical protein